MSWIPRVLDERVGPWKSHFEFHLKKYGGSLLLKYDYDVKNQERFIARRFGVIVTPLSRD